MEWLAWLANTELGKIFMTLCISMVPVVELRGGIPFGVAQGLGHWTALGVCVVGNLIPVPFIIIYIRRIFHWMRRMSPWLDRKVAWLENRGNSKKELVARYQMAGLFLLVAIPLPGTGAWTGALVAALMDMRLKQAFPAIVLGVMAAGVIVSIITYGVTFLI